MAAKGQQPGESDRDYFRRLSQESARQKQQKRDDAIQERLDKEAAFDRDLNNMVADGELADFLKSELGVNPDHFSKFIFDPDDAADMAKWDQRTAHVREEYLQIRKKRLFDSKQSRNKRVKKFLKQNKRQIQKGANKYGKGKGKGLLGFFFG